MGLNQNYPSLAQFVAGQAQFRGAVELIDQPLYDRILYPTAGVAGSLTFFSTPQGSGQSTESGAAAGTTKGLVDTNMTQQGQLPSPQAFWVRDIQILVDAGSISTASLFATQTPVAFNATAAATVQAGITDKNAILNSGVLNFSVGQKPYLQLGPLSQFPPQARIRVDAAAMAGTNAQPAAYVTQLLYSDGCQGIPTRTLDPGVGIGTGVNFQVQLTWPGLIATPTNNARVAVHLGGWLIRSVQ
jgi:hypothetical protein